MNIFKKAAEWGTKAAQSRHAEKIYNTVKIISAISDESREVLEKFGVIDEVPQTVIEQSADPVLMEFEDPYLDEMEAKIKESSRPERLTNKPDDGKRERKNKKTEKTATVPMDDPPPKNAEKSSETANGSRFTAAVDTETGTITQKGSPTIQKGKHDHMPKRTAAYRTDDERGHIQASSLGGDNSANNVVPQSRDLNRGAYYHMEQGEKDAIKAGATIDSEKIAYSSGGPGSRPDVFMVNDTITYPDGRTQQVNLSFANLSNQEQEDYNRIAAENSDMLGTPDYESMGVSKEEYAAMMEESDGYGMSIRDEYADTRSSVKAEDQPKEKAPKKEDAQGDDGQGAAKNKSNESAKADKGNGIKPSPKPEEQREEPAKKNGNGTESSSRNDNELTKGEEGNSTKTPKQQTGNEPDPSKNTANGTTTDEQNNNSQTEHQSGDPDRKENKDQSINGKKPKSEEETLAEPEPSGTKTGNHAQGNRTNENSAESANQAVSQKTEKNNTNTTQKQSNADSGNSEKNKDDGIGR